MSNAKRTNHHASHITLHGGTMVYVLSFKKLKFVEEITGNKGKARKVAKTTVESGLKTIEEKAKEQKAVS